MSIEALKSLPEILKVVQDARVRALRWDVIPNALVLDVDCAMETRRVGELRMARVCRAWLVIEHAHDLVIHIGWNKFREGFSLMDIQQESEGLDDLRYCFQTDFPEGTLTVAGRPIVLLRSTDALDVQGLELPTEKRNSVGSDSEFIVAHMGGNGDNTRTSIVE
jgi:hypothetical protein